MELVSIGFFAALEFVKATGEGGLVDNLVGNGGGFGKFFKSIFTFADGGRVGVDGIFIDEGSNFGGGAKGALDDDDVLLVAEEGLEVDAAPSGIGGGGGMLPVCLLSVIVIRVYPCNSRAQIAKIYVDVK